jgi:hypothetical protein
VNHHAWQAITFFFLNYALWIVAHLSVAFPIRCAY